MHIEGDLLQDVALAVEGVDVLQAEQDAFAGCALARLRRQRMGAGADIDLLHPGR
ncbi:hypothetical protein D3C87_2017940 [compost metagenome]